MQENLDLYVDGAKIGNEKDIEYLFKFFKKSIEFYAYKISDANFDFEDAVQEGNIGLFKAVLSYKSEGKANFETYAKKCILNNIITAYNSSCSQKHKILTDAFVLQENDCYLNIEADFLKQEQNKEFIKTAKEKLSGYEFLIFSLYTLKYSYSEIAQITKKDVKSVNNAVQRIRKKLSK